MPGTAVHAGVILRSCRRRLPLIRRRPGRKEHRNLSVSALFADVQCLLQHRKDVLPVSFQRESKKFRVLKRILDRLIFLQRVITAVNVRADEMKPAAVLPEELLQNISPGSLFHSGQKIGTRLRDGTAKALNFLICDLRIQVDHAGFQMHRLIGFSGHRKHLLLHNRFSICAKGHNLSAFHHAFSFSNQPKAAHRPRSQASQPFQSSVLTVSIRSFQLQ